MDQDPSRPAWFDEIGRPPGSIPPDADRPAPLLFDGEHRPINSRAAWLRHRETLVAAWELALGPGTDRPAEPAVTVLQSAPLDNGSLLRDLIRYEVEPGFATEAYRLGPSGAEPGACPGCLVFHSTVDHTIQQPAVLEGPPEFHLGLHLARRGFVTLSPRNFLWRYGAGKERFDAAVAWHLKQHTRSTGMAVMLHESIVAFDVLARDPRIDRTRIGAIGHSLALRRSLEWLEYHLAH